MKLSPFIRKTLILCFSSFVVLALVASVNHLDSDGVSKDSASGKVAEALNPFGSEPEDDCEALSHAIIDSLSQEILDRHWMAIGGAARWSKIREVSTSGLMHMGSGVNRFIYNRNTYQQGPGFFLEEIEVPGSKLAQALADGVVHTYVDDESYVLEGMEVRAIRHLLLPLAGNAMTVGAQYLGESMVKGRRVYVLARFQKNDQEFKEYYDAETYLKLQVHVAEGFEICYSDHIRYAGVVIPGRIQISFANLGKQLTYETEHVFLNQAPSGGLLNTLYRDL